MFAMPAAPTYRRHRACPRTAVAGALVRLVITAVVISGGLLVASAWFHTAHALPAASEISSVPIFAPSTVRASSPTLAAAPFTAAASSTGVTPASVTPASVPAASVPAASETFWVTAWDTGAYRQAQAAMVYAGEHCVIYLEDGQWVAPYTIQKLGTEFDSRVYPWVTPVLGSEPNPGVDGDARIFILLCDLKDISVSGYFSPVDVAPEEKEAHSNRREIIYLDSAAVASDPKNAGSLAAHEFAHLIVYYRDYMLDPSPARAPETDWLTEGFTTYAESLAGYDGRTGSLLLAFASDTDMNLTCWADDRGHYGASYAFMSYLAAREGPGMIGALIDNPSDGVAGINAILRLRGSTNTFDSLLDDWAVANFLDGRGIESPPYSYPNLDVAASPLTVSGPLPKVGYEYVSNFGCVYLDFPVVSTESAFNVVVDGEGSAPLRAALISWDSKGFAAPSVTPLALKDGDGSGSAAAGYDRHTLAVWARGTVGDEVLYSFRYSAAVNPVGGMQFLDLQASDPFFPYVTDLLARHVISGKEIPPGSGLWYFQGGENVMRAQFAKMIMEATGLHTLKVERLDDPTFRDVRPVYNQAGEPQAYPYDYVEEAAALGIVNGFADGAFRPYNPITRGQLVLMISRGAAAAGTPLPAYTGATQVFADVLPSNPIYPEVMAAWQAGILGGSRGDDGRLYFRPYAQASRNHVAKMTSNLIKVLEGLIPGAEPA